MSRYSAMLTYLLGALAVVVLTLGTWFGANYARGVYQARQQDRQNIQTIIQFLQYNIAQGRLLQVPPQAPAPTPPASPASGVQSSQPQPAPGTPR